MTRTVIGANLAGALVVYLYLQFLSQGIIDPHIPHSAFAVSMGVFSAYFVLAAAVVTLRMRAASRAGRSLDEDHPPTAEAIGILLGVPRRITAFTTGCWVGAAGLYAALDSAYGEPGAQVVHVVVGILLGGVVTTAVTHLLAERLHRPVVVRVLAGHPPAGRRAAIRGRLLVAWLVGSAAPLVALGLTPFVHASRAYVSLQVSIASLAALGLVAGYLVTSATAAAVSEPLDSVRRALSAVRGGDLSVHIEVDDPGEIGRLEADVNSMVAGLRERRRLEELFGRHVGREVASQALTEEAVLGGRQLPASVLFVDLIGSTALAASRPPDQLVTLLNRLFSRVVQAVTEEGGWVNKFEGDGALCVFGAPVARPDHAAAALRAARRLRQMLADAARSDPALEAGIGVAGGTVVAGNLGAVDRYEYTVIGDPVNEAARLSELAKSSPLRLLASGEVVAAAGDEAAWWQRRGEEHLRGRDRPTTVMAPTDTPAVARTPGRVLQPPATAGTIETV
jgi:adenylate cyclase